MADAFTERLRLAADQLTPERRLLHVLALMGGSARFALWSMPRSQSQALLLAAQTLTLQGLAIRDEPSENADLVLIVSPRGHAALSPRLAADHPQGVHHA